jgi:hypothetical protein
MSNYWDLKLNYKLFYVFLLKKVRFGTVVLGVLSGSALLFLRCSALLFRGLVVVCGSALLFVVFGTVIHHFVQFGTVVHVVRHCCSRCSALLLSHMCGSALLLTLFGTVKKPDPQLRRKFRSLSIHTQSRRLVGMYCYD